MPMNSEVNASGMMIGGYVNANSPSLVHESKAMKLSRFNEKKMSSA